MKRYRCDQTVSKSHGRRIKCEHLAGQTDAKNGKDGRSIENRENSVVKERMRNFLAANRTTNNAEHLGNAKYEQTRIAEQDKTKWVRILPPRLNFRSWRASLGRMDIKSISPPILDYCLQRSSGFII